MEENDRRIAESGAELKLLIDSSAYLDLCRIGDATGIHPLNHLENYHNIAYYFAQAVSRELMQGKEGINPNTLNMLKRSLVDEQAVIDPASKDNRFVYEHKSGEIRVVVLNSMSAVDRGQILLCQNHKELVLLTNDHKMIKSAAALLDRRLLDVGSFLDMMVNTPEESMRLPWVAMRKWFKRESGYRPPHSVRIINDRKHGQLPKHLRK